MNQKEVRKLDLGLYRIYWKESKGGGNSLAAVGNTATGTKWLAPINWLYPSSEYKNTWLAVKEVKLIRKPQDKRGKENV